MLCVAALRGMTKTMTDYCTYFDQHYLIRGLALYQSLVSHCAPFRLWILCLDDVCFDVLTKLDLSSVRPLRLADLEAADPQLARTRLNRTLIEYYFTCTPAFVMHLVHAHQDIAALTYLDADLYFTSDPAALFEEVQGHSIAIVPHRYPARLAHMNAAFGTYNVGWIWFRRDEQGLACLAWWRERCIEWCYDRVEDGKYADQRYLDEWPQRFPGVRVIQHRGANLAPWNLKTHHLSLVDGGDGGVMVDGQPLLFYHFHRLRQIRPWLYAPRLTDFLVPPNALVRQHIYVPYLRAVRAMHRTVQPFAAEVKIMGSLRGEFTDTSATLDPSLAQRLTQALSRLIEVNRRVITREYFIFVGNHVL